MTVSLQFMAIGMTRALKKVPGTTRICPNCIGGMRRENRKWDLWCTKQFSWYLCDGDHSSATQKGRSFETWGCFVDNSHRNKIGRHLGYHNLPLTVHYDMFSLATILGHLPVKFGFFKYFFSKMLLQFFIFIGNNTEGGKSDWPFLCRVSQWRNAGHFTQFYLMTGQRHSTLSRVTILKTRVQCLAVCVFSLSTSFKTWWSLVKCIIT